MQHNKEISFLLGAGFSAEAGIPIRSTINSRLGNLNWDEFMIYSETTTRFLRQPDPNSNWQNVKERMFISEFIVFYKNKICSEFDYEEFYDYAYKLSNGHSDALFDVFFGDFQARMNNYPDRGNALSVTIRSIDYLLEDLLRFESDIFEQGIVDHYLPFLRLLRKLEEQFDVITIYSLNHDLLLEKLLMSEMSLEYADGFQINGSPYFIKKSGRQIRIPYFSNKFDKNVRFIKLHGSIDNYVYNISEPFEMVKIAKDLYPPDLHRELNVEGKWVEENCWTLYEPEFLSGTTTKILSYDRPFYVTQFERFKESLKNSRLLISVGYGLEDSKINEFIETALKDQLKNIVVKRTKKPEAFFENPNVTHYGEGLGISDLSFEGIAPYLES